MRSTNTLLAWLAISTVIGCDQEPGGDLESSQAAGAPSSAAATSAAGSDSVGSADSGAGATSSNPRGGSDARGGAESSGAPGSGNSSGSAGVASGGTAGAAGNPSWVTAFKRPVTGCALCHGASGEGLPGVGPDIQHPTREVFDYLVREGEPNQLAQYRDPMPAFDQTLLSDEDLAAIYAWLSAMPQPTTAASLFADHCSYCHGADGRGGQATAAYASAYHSAPFRRKGAEFRDYVRAGHVVDDAGAPVPVSERHAYMPAFPPELLSDAEIQQLEAWLPQ